jgi:lysophospholipase L1-like esterase
MKRDWWSKEFRTLITLGESITAGGWASCRERSWPAQLTRMMNEVQRYPVQLVNVGIGANMISSRSPGYRLGSKPSAADRLEKHVLSNNANGAPVIPDLLVIAYGMNDAAGGTPLKQFIDDLADVIDRVRKKFELLIVLAGPYFAVDIKVGGPGLDHADLKSYHRFNDATRALAKKKQCLFADLLAAFDEAPWMVHRDGIHSNDLGHRVVANTIFNLLAANCSGLGSETKAVEPHILPWRDEAILQDFSELTDPFEQTGGSPGKRRKRK